MTVHAGQAFFERLGVPLDETERAALAAVVNGVPGWMSLTAGRVESWIELARIVQSQHADDDWADWEEGERERLWSLASEQHTEHDLHRRLSAMNEALSSDAAHAASQAAERDGVADAGLVGAAAAAALLAAHQASLVGLAGLAPEHYFRLKFELFRAGRWPLGVVDGVYRVF
jgi:hypothetical protein